MDELAARLCEVLGQEVLEDGVILERLLELLESCKDFVKGLLAGPGGLV